MKISVHASVLTAVLLCFAGQNESANILGLFAMPGKSHFNVFKILMEGLAKKGHNVTVVSFFPRDKPLKGYTDISLEGLVSTFSNAFNIEDLNTPWPTWMKAMGTLYGLSAMGQLHCEAVLPSSQIQELLTRKGDFDLAITELFNTDCFLAVLHKLEVPYIGFSSSGMIPYHNTRFANPMDPAIVNNILIGKTTRMDLCARIQNSIVNLAFITLEDFLVRRPAQQLVRKYIGDTPPLKALAENASLMFLNQHFSFQQPRPLASSVIEIGGIHIQPAKPLPKDLEEFVSGAEAGVVVFSMGSVLNAASMSEDKKSAFLNVFGSIPQRVIWKISGEIPNLPPNVKLMDWIPQRDLLAHKKVQAFIGHGGLGGMLECIVTGTPFASIPIFGDQYSNVRAGVEAGVAVEMSFNSITENSVREAITTLLSDKYQAQAKYLARKFNDRPMAPLDLAIYWTEYILKYGPHSVRSAAMDLSTIEYYSLDLIAIFTLAISLTVYVSMKMLCKLCNLFKKKSDKKEKKKQS